MKGREAIITARPINDRVFAIDISGELTKFAEDDLMETYAQTVEMDAKAIVLNFEKLDFLNSSGIGLLITLLIRAQRAEQRLIAFGLNEHFSQIFHLTNLNEAIHLYPTEADAMAAIL
jgi:anti-sigma B factor antagonist